MKDSKRKKILENLDNSGYIHKMDIIEGLNNIYKDIDISKTQEKINKLYKDNDFYKKKIASF